MNDPLMKVDLTVNSDAEGGNMYKRSSCLPRVSRHNSANAICSGSGTNNVTL